MKPSEPHRLVGPQCKDDVTLPACRPEFSGLSSNVDESKDTVSDH